MAALWCVWTGASTLGLLLALRLTFPLIGQLENLPAPLPWPWWGSLVMATAGGSVGAVLGACQAVVLGPRLGARGALAWAAATSGGAALAMGVARGGEYAFRLFGAGPAFYAVDEQVWRFFAVAMLGAATGGGQWLVLRRRVSGAAWWVAAWAVGTLATELALRSVPSGADAMGFSALALLGGVTGAVLALLPRKDGAREPTLAQGV